MGGGDVVDLGCMALFAPTHANQKFTACLHSCQCNGRACRQASVHDTQASASLLARLPQIVMPVPAAFQLIHPLCITHNHPTRQVH